jgi:hypothetical protein
METSALASMMALPRKGHLDAVFHMFAFLRNKHNAVMILIPLNPTLMNHSFQRRIGVLHHMENAVRRYLAMHLLPEE